jgi:hypothetical protein
MNNGLEAFGEACPDGIPEAILYYKILRVRPIEGI